MAPSRVLTPATVLELLEIAQRQILSDMAKRLARGGSPGAWQVRRLQELASLTTEAKRRLGGLPQRELYAAIVRAYTTGARDAFSELGLRRDREVADLAARVGPLAQAYYGELTAAYAAVLRTTQDAYRAAVAEAAASQLAGVLTHQQAAQVAMDRLAAQGLTAFVDRSGRQWSISTYAQMATRTTFTRASQAGHMDTLTANGHNLVMVSKHARECPLCRPWEGQVLSIELPDAEEAKYAKATVDQARSAGLNHPRCRHRFVAYFPGITKDPPKERYSDDGLSYEAQQELRRAQRTLLQWQRRHAAAVTPEAKAQARQKVSEWRARVKRTKNG